MRPSRPQSPRRICVLAESQISEFPPPIICWTRWIVFRRMPGPSKSAVIIEVPGNQGHACGDSNARPLVPETTYGDLGNLLNGRQKALQLSTSDSPSFCPHNLTILRVVTAGR